MKTNKSLGINTLCTHAGGIEDVQFKGAVSPIYVSSSYAFQDVDVKRYPRYFNTPNQEGLSKKIAALEKTESALIFGSGMAAVSSALFSFLGKGDHVVIQKEIYGGTYNLIVEEFDKYGIEYDFAQGVQSNDFESLIKDNTRVIYVETPSNPLLKLVDLKMIGNLSKHHKLVSMIDNTFASPINQNPVDFGIDIVIHSATKYMGGHSDICAGVVAASNRHIEKIFSLAKNLGGSLSDYTVWLLERSIKTMGLRVKAQNDNALQLAQFLENSSEVKKVYYPGLESHEDYDIAVSQMQGFGGMLSFELKNHEKAARFHHQLQFIKPSMSLAGVESTILLPSETSHALLSENERKEQNISDCLYRLSVGIENIEDLKEDITKALKNS